MPWRRSRSPPLWSRTTRITTACMPGSCGGSGAWMQPSRPRGEASPSTICRHACRLSVGSRWSTMAGVPMASADRPRAVCRARRDPRGQRGLGGGRGGRAQRARACARTDPERHHRLSEILAMRGRHREAAAALETAIALAEQDLRRPTPRDSAGDGPALATWKRPPIGSAEFSTPPAAGMKRSPFCGRRWSPSRTAAPSGTSWRHCWRSAVRSGLAAALVRAATREAGGR